MIAAIRVLNAGRTWDPLYGFTLIIAISLMASKISTIVILGLKNNSIRMMLSNIIFILT
jgi:hypothetical protein